MTVEAKAEWASIKEMGNVGLESWPTHLTLMINFKVFKTSDCLHWLFPFMRVSGDNFYRILTQYKGEPEGGHYLSVAGLDKQKIEGFKSHYALLLIKGCGGTIPQGAPLPIHGDGRGFLHPVLWHTHWKGCCTTANSVAGKTDTLCLSWFCRMAMKIVGLLPVRFPSPGVCKHGSCPRCAAFKQSMLPRSFRQELGLSPFGDFWWSRKSHSPPHIHVDGRKAIFMAHAWRPDAAW